MIELEKFTEADFDRFISWVTNEKELIQFAGPLFQYPLSHHQLRCYLNESKKVPYRVRQIDTGRIIGHCELNFENEVPRLSRILIGEKQFRNQGLGKQIIKAMINIVFGSTEFSSVDLSVFDWNLNAIACYQQLGFIIRPEKETLMTVDGEIWKAHNMILIKDNFLYKSDISLK